MSTEPTAQIGSAWPFQAGEAVYYLPSDFSWIRPLPIIPATLLACEHLAGANHARLHHGRATIQRDDKARPTSIRASNLVYRGYCSACEVPAILGSDNTLICPRCHEDAVALPPPDRLVVRWFPLEEWLHSMVMRRQMEHPTWPWRQAREAMDETIKGGYNAMLERLQLNRRLHVSIDNYVTDDYQNECRLMGLLRAYAILDDAGAFLATDQELVEFQREMYRKDLLTSRVKRLTPEQVTAVFEGIHDLEDADPPPAPPRPVYLDLPEPPEHTTDDAEPDGSDATTAWLEQQFRRAA